MSPDARPELGRLTLVVALLGDFDLARGFGDTAGTARSTAESPRLAGRRVTSDVINVSRKDSILDFLKKNVCLELNALANAEKVFLIETLMGWITCACWKPAASGSDPETEAIPAGRISRAVEVRRAAGEDGSSTTPHDDLIEWSVRGGSVGRRLAGRRPEPCVGPGLCRYPPQPRGDRNPALRSWRRSDPPGPGGHSGQSRTAGAVRVNPYPITTTSWSRMDLIANRH